MEGSVAHSLSSSFNKAAATLHLIKQKKYNHDQDGEISLWHQLPGSIMKIIVKRLSLPDRVCMSIVCKSWGSLLLKDDKKLIVNDGDQLPWLVLPHGQGPRGVDNRRMLSFYSLEDGRFFNLKLPKKARGGYCCGSSKGWLGIITGSNSKPYFFVWNPFSGAVSELPPLTKLPCFKEFIKGLPKIYNATKFINRFDVSSANSSGAEQLIVAVLCNNKTTLAFCTVGDKRWKIFKGKTGVYTDILFSKNILYTLDVSINYSLSRKVEKTEYKEDEPIDLTIISITHVHGSRKFQQHTYKPGGLAIAMHCVTTFSLVESSQGELLMIKQNVDVFQTLDDQNSDEEVIHGYEYAQTRGFEIFTVNLNGNMESLTSLGHQMLFSTHSCSVSAPTSKFGHEFDRGNCVYFVADPSCGIVEYEPNVSREAGVFYLEDGKIKRNIPSFKLPMKSHPCWFTPSSQ